jgi:hypothetical protein
MTFRTTTIFLISSLAVAVGAQQTAPAPTDRAPVTKAQVVAWMNSISTWGKWGADDQLGAVNYITPAKRRQAAGLVRSGEIVSMARPVVLEARHAEIARDGKPNGVPFYEMTFRTFPKGDPRGNEDFTSDVQSFAPHGPLLTHLDALCHYSNGEGQLYNGFPLSSVSQDKGCTRLGLDTLKQGIVTRGILIDMTQLQARRVGARRVYVEDIEAFEKQTGITVSAGDAVFVHDPAPAGAPRGGIDASVVPWMQRRGVALTSGIARVPEDGHADHRLPIVAAGIFLLDSPELATLATTAQRLGRWEFMLTIAPPLAPGATGFPVNPLAMF